RCARNLAVHRPARRAGPLPADLPDPGWAASVRRLAARRARPGGKPARSGRRRVRGDLGGLGPRRRGDLRRSGRRVAGASGLHGRVREDAQAVRRPDREVPGAAAPHGGDAHPRRAGAVDELPRGDPFDRFRPRRAPPRGLRGQGGDRAVLPEGGAGGGADPRRDGDDGRAARGPLLQAADRDRAFARRHRAPPGEVRPRDSRTEGDRMSAASWSTRGPIAVITLDNPPVNGLGYELRRGILEGLDRAEADPAIKVVVLIGSGRGFSGGADIREFNTPKMIAEPTLRTVIRAIEGGRKPVIAAIHGMAMGGGMELALGSHYRVAAAGAQVGLPEVKLGLLPGAGGTQRLPRAIGVEAAVNLIVSGAVVPVEQLRGTALVDAFLEGNLLEGAVAFAKKVVAENRKATLLRDVPVRYPNAEGFFEFARGAVGAVSKGYPAPLKALEAVAASATQPFEEGLRTERELFLQL